MSKIPTKATAGKPVTAKSIKRAKATAMDDSLRHLAFDNSIQANIISRVNNGKIIMANLAACKLLGYSRKALLTKRMSGIFNIRDSHFKKMMKERAVDGKAAATVMGIRKNGKLFPCDITSAVFADKDGIQKSITTMTDISQSMLKQSKIDTAKDRIVAGNIILAKSRQKKIDIENRKTVNHDIFLAQKKSEARLVENNEWIRYIARASYDVMWDWNIATNEIYVGDSIEEVFGYKVVDNLASYTAFSQCLLPEEKETVESRIAKVLASGSKTWNDSCRIRRQDGSVASTSIRASIVRDEQGKAVRLIGAIQDISRLQELEKKLAMEVDFQESQTEKLTLVSKLSFDVIWDWNLLTNEVFRGDGFEELLGFPKKNYKGDVTDWSDQLHPGDRIRVETALQAAIASGSTHWECSFRFIRADGSSARVFERASIFRNDSGKAYRMIGIIHDLSRQKELEESLADEIANKGKLLTEYSERFNFIFNSSTDVLYDYDLATGYIVISDAYEKEYGYKAKQNRMTIGDWISHIHPDDQPGVSRHYKKMLKAGNREWKYNYRFLRKDGSVVNVISCAVIVRHADGKAYRIIGSVQDRDKKTVLAEKTQSEIRLKEVQFTEAVQEAKEAERSEIGRELHDNINQLLSASRMYLDMAKRGGAETETYLSRSSEYTVMAIEEIRKLTKGLTTDIIKNLGLCEAITTIAQDTQEVNPIKISCDLKGFRETDVSEKFKLNMYRVVQEQLANILKHAHATEVTIALSQSNKTIRLVITDNGVGFDIFKKNKGIGLANIKSRVVNYQGTIDFVSKPGLGCTLNVVFPVSGNRLQ